MVSNSEPAEYGLVFEDSQLNPKTCEECKTLYTTKEGLDWVCCPSCGEGLSRMDLLPEKWEKSLPDDLALIALKYKFTYSGKRDIEKAWWGSLVTGAEAENVCPGISRLQNHVRLIVDNESYQQLGHIVLSKKNLRGVDLPVMAIRLADVYGRTTGIAIAEWRGDNLISHQNFAITPGARAGLLPHTDRPVVLVPDLGKVLKTQKRYLLLSGTFLPIAYVDLSVPNWAPHTNDSKVLIIDELTPEYLRAIPDCGCSVVISSQFPVVSTIAPASAMNWYQGVIANALPWEIAVAGALSTMKAHEAADLLQKANLAAPYVERILHSCKEHKRMELVRTTQEAARIYRWAKRAVIDDGVSWKTADGQMVLSGSLQVYSVKRDENNKIVYSCRLVTAKKTIDFQAGQELERDAFTVVLRESLLQGVNVSYNRSYSKNALEIAVGLRPLSFSPDCLQSPAE